MKNIPCFCLLISWLSLFGTQWHAIFNSLYCCFWTTNYKNNHAKNLELSANSYLISRVNWLKFGSTGRMAGKSQSSFKSKAELPDKGLQATSRPYVFRQEWMKKWHLYSFYWSNFQVETLKGTKWALAHKFGRHRQSSSKTVLAKPYSFLNPTELWKHLESSSSHCLPTL